ncbi:P-loop containing nucleoside triphosphate hydrolase protein [Elsinoe ampelina]|uniref:Kinesin-like protein n=1 Tax=Elsinoe ampelina TaxID=302913 RepID=A0A6A6G7Z0_9PEZI|nr:P-loop containing nucleoside triphosphate hydrolase protein [Elsinoe ampelina]
MHHASTASTLPPLRIPSAPTIGPPNMPLPALPSSKTRSRLPETPNSSLGRRESSGSGIPTPTSSIPTPTSSTRKTTPVDSPSSPISPGSPSRRRSFRKTVSIGSFPQPPRGGFGALGSISSSAESTPSLPSSTKANTPLAFSSRATSPATLADAPNTRKSDRHLNVPSDLDSRPSSAHGSAVTDGTHFEDVDPLTAAPTNLKSGKEYSKEGKDMKGNVVVSVRVRPNGGDTTANPDWVVDNKRALISYKGGEGGDFRYDNVFSNGDDNGRVYDSAAKRLVRRVMEGYHGTVFAYGCTSTGKTFSMQGTAASPGIIPLAITDIFSYIREQPHREFLLRVSYLEIYNEKIYDLLSPNAGAGMQEDIKLREDSKRGVYATPLKEEIVQSPTQLLRVIARGDLCRRTGSTQFNARSSRSHAVVQIVVESRARVDPASSGLPSGVLVSTLSLIDLAGSERAAEDRDRRKEGSHINKSLLTLGTVISRLSEQKPDATALPSKSHLPYRDSKLTRLLSSALSGNSLISILCTIQLSPMGAFGPLNAMAAPSETLNTLSFASRAKNNIVSHAKRNESIPGLGGEARALLDRYKAEIEDLRKQLDSQTRNSTAPETPLSVAPTESKEARPERTEEEERKWLERERESAERHEAQMLEMQLARTALKERIGHLNRLILSSKSVGVNAGVKVSRQGSLVEGLETSRPGYQRAFSLGSAGLKVPGFVAGEALAEESEDDLSAESGEASPASRITALQADIKDKNRYIATLERRLLEARRTSGGKRRKSSGVGTGGWEEVVAEKDREIEELKKRLDDAARMGNALRSAARRRDMGRKISTITSPTGQGHAHTMSMSSNGSRSINFSRLTPVGILSPSKAGFGEDPMEVERPMDSGKSLRSQKSLEEMTRMLDGMIAQKVEEGVPGLFGVKTMVQVAVGDAR